MIFEWAKLLKKRAVFGRKNRRQECFLFQHKVVIFALPILGSIAGVVKLVDTLDLGSSASRCEGSSPFARTKKLFILKGFFYGINDTILAGESHAIWQVH